MGFGNAELSDPRSLQAKAVVRPKNKTLDAQNILQVRMLPEEEVKIHKGVLMDRKLALAEKGLFCLLRSMPSDWIFYATDLAERCGVSRPTMGKLLKRLIEESYLSREPLRGQQGCYMGYLYTIYPCRRKLYLELLEKRGTPCQES